MFECLCYRVVWTFYRVVTVKRCLLRVYSESWRRVQVSAGTTIKSSWKVCVFFSTVFLLGRSEKNNLHPHRGICSALFCSPVPGRYERETERKIKRERETEKMRKFAVSTERSCPASESAEKPKLKFWQHLPIPEREIHIRVLRGRPRYRSDALRTFWIIAHSHTQIQTQTHTHLRRTACKQTTLAFVDR